MFASLHAVGMCVAGMFKSRSRLEAENLFLRHQLDIVRAPKSRPAAPTTPPETAAAGPRAAPPPTAVRTGSLRQYPAASKVSPQDAADVEFVDLLGSAFSAMVACVPFSSISRQPERPGDHLDHDI